LKGVVKRWFAYRGYGFITPDDEAEDVFVHISAVQGGRELREGETVEFEVERTFKGPKAVSVKPVAE